MYTPAPFANDDLQSCVRLMRANSFATLVSTIDGSPEATHVPVVVNTRDEVPEDPASVTVRFHLARNNPLVTTFSHGADALIIFTGAHTYISPDWYVSENMVPTWNYEAVHVVGQTVMVNDSELVESLTQLAQCNEVHLNKPQWQPTSIEERHFTAMRKAIVGFDLHVKKIQGKHKMNQNRSDDDRKAVIDVLRQSSSSTDHEVAAIMERLLITER